jgi:hypothetical protein
MQAMTETNIIALLKETGAAHGVHERTALGGAYDEAWPTWYADYLVGHGLGELLHRAVTARMVSEALARIKAEDPRADRGEAWPPYYAKRLIALLG